MIYYKNLQTNEIIGFENENSIGQAFYDTTVYKKLTQSQSNAYELQKAKDDKKNQIEKNYKQSKLACQITYQNQSYSRSNGFDDMLNLCLQWKSSSQTSIPSLNIPVSLCSTIYDKLLLLRDGIAKNVETVKELIDGLVSVEEIASFQTQLQITFDASIAIENLSL